MNTIAIRHIAFENLGILEPFFEQRGDQVRYIDAPTANFAAENINAADLLVVLGAPIGVNETTLYPFLNQEIQAITHFIALNKPVLGICLGAQLIAKILGAKVEFSGHKEIGFAPITLTEAGKNSALCHLKNTPVLHWHGDMFHIPAGAAHLAATPLCPNQAFSQGKLLGLQFHLEANPNTIEQWLVGHACELAHAHINIAQIRADAQHHGAALREAGLKTIATWLDSIT